MENNEKVLKDKVRKKNLCRGKRKMENHTLLKDDQNKWQRKHRKVENASDRLREFLEATKYNAVFICSCCHQRMFHSSVRLYTKELVQEINSLKPGLAEACIEEPIIVRINAQENSYLCLICVRHMKNRKMPPKSVMNGLKLKETDRELEAQNLELTELEGA